MPADHIIGVTNSRRPIRRAQRRRERRAKNLGGCSTGQKLRRRVRAKRECDLERRAGEPASVCTDVRLWHKADMATMSDDVRFNCGLRDIAPSLGERL